MQIVKSKALAIDFRHNRFIDFYKNIELCKN